MYGLSLGIHQVSEILPSAAYAFISGLNAATVGIIGLAAVQLSDKAITDKLTRVIVFMGACAGMLYSTLWYYPVLLAGAGAFTVAWDKRWMHKTFFSAKRRLWPRRQEERPNQDDVELQPPSVLQSEAVGAVTESAEMAKVQAQSTLEPSTTHAAASTSEHVEERRIPATHTITALSWKQGLLILAFFLAILIVVLILRSTLHDPPFPLSLYSNFFLAGTLIFGGGPVVTPLLSQYVVQPGWVSTRDFLLGLAIINAFPGPNFNFAVYLGSLAALGAAARGEGSVPSYSGALLGYVGIFVPGLAAISGLMGIWSYLRSKPWLKSVLRGVNALAVGLVFTAVYKLWQVGVLDKQNMGRGSPLGSDPWWVVITATSFVGGRWFGINAVSAIILGGVMGLIWYGVTQA
jgi:chromate transport protein ChrA